VNPFFYEATIKLWDGCAQITQIHADYVRQGKGSGGMSCRCAAIHAAGVRLGRFFLTRRREGAKKTNTRKNGGMSCRYAAIHAADRKTRGRDLCVRPAVLCGWSIFVEAVCVFGGGHSW